MRKIKLSRLQVYTMIIWMDHYSASFHVLYFTSESSGSRCHVNTVSHESTGQKHQRYSSGNNTIQWRAVVGGHWPGCSLYNRWIIDEQRVVHATYDDQQITSCTRRRFPADLMYITLHSGARCPASGLAARHKTPSMSTFHQFVKILSQKFSGLPPLLYPRVF